MLRREEGLVEIHARLVAARDTIGLKGLKRSPTTPIDEKYLPCVFIIEDTDIIMKESGRSSHGYSTKRLLEVTLEMIASKESDIKLLYRVVRSAVFEGGIIVADNNTFIREIRTEGPTGYGLPDVLGMRLVLALSYTDDGK